MELILYKFIGNDKKIDKPEPPENAITLQGHLRESCDIKNPIITVTYNAEILKCNYAKITAFDKPRYYFVKKTPYPAERIRSFDFMRFRRQNFRCRADSICPFWQ